MSAILVLSKELEIKAKTELNEDPSRVQRDLNELNAWLDKTPHIKARRDDQFLIAFLRGCKFSLEKAKSKIEAYYTNRKAFGSRKITPEIINCLRSGCMIPFPQTNGTTGPRNIFFRSVYDPENVELDDAVKTLLIAIDILQLEDDNTVVAGIGILADAQQAKLGHFTKFTPPYMQKFMKNLEEANPNRVKSFEFTNLPPFTVPILNLLKFFFSEKLRSRLKIHACNEELFKSIPQKLFPKEYGGEAGPIVEIVDVWVKKFQQYKKFFEEEEEKYGIIEELRPKKLKDADEIFGVEGSFRKLDIF